MCFRDAILSVAFLVGSLEPALAQARPSAPATPPNPALVQQAQAALARDQVKGDLHGESGDLRTLIVLYRNNPAMQAQYRAQLDQVSAQILQQDKIARIPLPSRAPAAPAAPAVARTSAPVAPASYPTGSVYQPAAATPDAAPMPAPPSPAQAGPSPTSSTNDNLSKFFSGAVQIYAQARQLQKQQKAARAAKTTPNAIPATPAPVDPAVVIGYDANNQPIFAAPPAAPASPPTAGVVMGYDANNQPIFAPAPSPPATTSSDPYPPAPTPPAGPPK